MSEEKKYSAQEAAIAVLKKAEEMLKKSSLLKQEPKAQQAEASDSAFEVKPESSKSSNDARLGETQEPSLNPKEEAGAPGTNKEWGTAPETYSTLKLAKFLGHMDSKRKSKSVKVEE